MLDVIFNEDDCHVRNANAALNLSTLRKLAQNFVSASPSKIPIKRKIKKACVDNAFLVSILSPPQC